MREDIQPDYSSYSYRELEACLERVDKERYPVRANIIMELLNDSKITAELKQRDKIKKSYNSDEEKFLHITFEATLFILSFIALVATGYFSF